MASLKSIFGLLPSTESYEASRKQLADEYQSLLQYAESDQLKRYLQLKDYIESEEFKNEKNKLLTLKFKGSAEYIAEQEFLKLKKNKHIALYNRTIDSDEFKNYIEVKGSSDLKEFQKLEETVNSEDFQQIMKFYALSAKKRFAASDLASTLKKYKEQAGRKDIKSYKKIINHKLFYSSNQFIESGKLEKLNILSEQVQSAPFKSKKAGMKRAEFQASEEGKIWEKYKNLINTAEYKAFKKISSTRDYQAYKKLHGTAEMEGFLDLEKFINSNEFKIQKQEIEAKNFEDTPEYKTFYEYERLKKDSKIKAYHTFIKSKAFENYREVHKSNMLKKFESLLEQTSSPEFIEQKAFLVQAPKVRWKSSKAFKKLSEFEELTKTKEIKWYLGIKDSNKFDWLKSWTLSFEELFNTQKLDRKKWLPRYFWGEEILNDSYSLDYEKHYISNGDNLSFTGNSLKIETRREKVTGKAWHPMIGFIPREFDYTSGLINTAKSFRQLYGTFEAKIKFNASKKVLNAFWMASSKMGSHIDIAKALDTIELGNKWKVSDDAPVQQNTKKLKRSKFANTYFIYSLEWEKDKLIWRVNGKVMATSNQGVPSEPLYLVLSSGLLSNVNGAELPAAMEVEWVRCYKKTATED